MGFARHRGGARSPLRTGHFTVVTHHDILPARPNLLFPTAPYTGWWDDPGLATVTVPGAENPARSLPDEPASRLRCTGSRRSTPAAGGHLIHEVLAAEVASSSVLMRAQVVQTATRPC